MHADVHACMRHGDDLPTCESQVVTSGELNGPRSRWNLTVSARVPPAAYLREAGQEGGVD